MSLSDKRQGYDFKNKEPRAFIYLEKDIKESIKELKQKVEWGKHHGNGDVNSTKAVLEHIDKSFGSQLLSSKSEDKS